MSIYLPFIVVFKGQFDHGNKTVGSFRQHSRNRKLFEELEHLWLWLMPRLNFFHSIFVYCCETIVNARNYQETKDLRLFTPPLSKNSTNWLQPRWKKKWEGSMLNFSNLRNRCTGPGIEASLEKLLLHLVTPCTGQRWIGANCILQQDKEQKQSTSRSYEELFKE